MRIHTTLAPELTLTMRFCLCLAFLILAPHSPTQGPKVIPEGYRVETIETPEGVAFGVGGLSFLPDGTLYACTREGEVWVRKGRSWSRFAAGLHEPLGIHVEADSKRVFVIQRPELTELVDEDGDGRADFFKTICDDWGLTDNYHEYAFGLCRDAQGNFYGTLNTTLSWKGWAGSTRWDIGRVHDSKMGRAARYRGWSFKVTPEGRFVPVSAGLRSPSGLTVTPEGEFFFTENQGDFVETSALHHIVAGRFHGHPASLMDHPDFKGKDLNAISVAEYQQLRTPPAVFFPHGDLASAPGEPVVDTSGGRFGPFAGQMFIGDQSRSNVFRVVLEKVDGQYQGCAINFVDHLQCGVIRSRFAPDGSLWVGQTGRGWGSRGPKKFGVQRLVWDQETVPFAIHGVSLTRSGFRVRFTEAPQRLGEVEVLRWRYQYRPGYGSKPEDKQGFAPRPQKTADAEVLDLALPLQAGCLYRFTFKGDWGDRPLRNRVVWYTAQRLR